MKLINKFVSHFLSQHFKQDYLKNIAEFPRDFFELKPSNNFLSEIEEYETIQKKISNTNKEIIF